MLKGHHEKIDGTNGLREGLKEPLEAPSRGLGVVTVRHLMSGTRFRMRPDCAEREVRTILWPGLSN